MDTRHQQRQLAALRFKRACEDSGGERLSLMHPRFNLREVAKQMILLEDHLSHPYKHCPDCVRKHLMTIEAFAEEAVTLDKLGVYWGVAEELAEHARHWLEDFEDDKPQPEIAQQVRNVRKNLVALVADPRDAVTRVASRFITVSVPCPHRRVAIG